MVANSITQPIFTFLTNIRDDYPEKGMYGISEEYIARPICLAIEEIKKEIFPFFDQHAADMLKWGFGAYLAGLSVMVFTSINPAHYAVFVASARALYILWEESNNDKSEAVPKDNGQSYRSGTFIGGMVISLYGLTLSQIIVASAVYFTGKLAIDYVNYNPVKPEYKDL